MICMPDMHILKTARHIPKYSCAIIIMQNILYAIPFFKIMRQMNNKTKITTVMTTINTTPTDNTTSIIIVHGITSSLESIVMGET